MSGHDRIDGHLYLMIIFTVLLIGFVAGQLKSEIRDLQRRIAVLEQGK